jgi:hypothetical protein
MPDIWIYFKQKYNKKAMEEPLQILIKTLHIILRIIRGRNRERIFLLFFA